MQARPFHNYLPTPMVLMVGAEAIVLFSAVYLSGLIAFGNLAVFESQIGPLALRAVSVAGVVIVCMISMGLYQFHERIRFREAAARIVAALTMSVLLVGSVGALLPATIITYKMAKLAIGLALLSLLIIRYFYMRTIDRNVFRRRCLIYGVGEKSSAISQLRRKADRRGFQIVGTIAPVNDAHGNAESIAEMAERTGAEEIVIAVDEQRGGLPIAQLLEVRLKGIEVIDVLEFLERETGKIRVDLVKPAWLIFSDGFRSSRLQQFNKRLIDLFASGVLLVVSLPIMLLVFVAIKLEDGWRAPVFYRQVRIGRNEESFTVLKFRSMIENAEQDGKAEWAQSEDVRITRVGGFLRTSRLDELPQILNVFRGQMSLVGPRPERPEFVESLKASIPYYSERHTVTPGITGWAQLKYGYGASQDDAVQKLNYDLYYVKNHSLMFDLVIILQTVEVVLWGKGAR
jgi:sugar transferase (PEP-CTERM system associated)